MKTALEEAREKLAEQNELLERLTDGALMYGTSLGDADGGVVVSVGDRMIRAHSAGYDCAPGKTLLLASDSGQIVSVSDRLNIGGTAMFVRSLDDSRAEVSVNGDRRVVIVGIDVDMTALREGDTVIMAGPVIVEAVPRRGYAVAETKVLWDQIGGQETAKSELREAIALLKGGSKLSNLYNMKAPKGILLYGPPGCGKTMLGKAVATELSEDTGGFIYVKAPEILNMYVGASEERVRTLFRAAKAYKEETGQTAVVFIDEADAILQKRGTGVSSDVEKTIVPSFLTEMDGLEESAAMVVLATNRPDTLDPAVIREGRVDRRILIERPTQPVGVDIFKLYFEGVPVADNIDNLANAGAAVLYRDPSIVSGAMIAAAVERSKRFALLRDNGAKKPSGVTIEDAEQGAMATLKEAA